MKRVLVFALLAGCASDCSDMKVRIVEDDTYPSRDERVGIGLTLYVDAYVLKSGVRVNPENLAVIADVPDAVDMNLGAIPIDRSGQARPQGAWGPTGKIVGLTPLAPGDNGFVFIADNTDESAGLSYEAIDVTHVQYLATPDATDAIADGTSWFINTQLTLFLDFWSGTQRVIGTTPLIVSAPTGATFAYTKNEYMYSETDPPYYFDLGRTPYTATLSTAAAAQTLTIHVVDSTGIARLGTDIAAPSLLLPLGGYERFHLVPFDANNRRILGTNYDRATSQVMSGTAAEVSAIFADGEVSIHGLEVGQSVLVFTWGTATVQVTVDVTAPQ